MTNAKNAIRELVTNGHIAEALEQLSGITTDDATQRKIDVISARYERYRQQTIKSILSQDQQTLEYNRIVNSLLELLSNESETISQKSSQPSLMSSGLNRKQWKYYLGGLAAIIAVLAGLAELSGYSLRDLFDGNESIVEDAQLTVYVHGPGGRQDYVLENEGSLILDLKNDRRVAQIGQYGRTNFGQIGISKGNSIHLSVKAANYELATLDSDYIYDGNPIYLEVRSTCRYCTLKGTVQYQNTMAEGLTVILKGTELIDTTDQNGHFHIQVPPSMEQDEYVLVILQNGKIKWENFVTTTAQSPIEILLDDL